MKMMLFTLSCVFCLKGCIAQNKEKEFWVIDSISTNYIQKGVKDVFELPDKKNIIGVNLQITNDTLVFLKTNKEFFCSDTLIVSNLFKLKRRKDDELSIVFPGDELSCLNEKTKMDTCYISQSFLSILGVKANFVNVYQLTTNKGELTSCKLFIIEKNKQMVFFNSNDFLLFRLFRKK